MPGGPVVSKEETMEWAHKDKCTNRRPMNEPIHPDTRARWRLTSSHRICPFSCLGSHADRKKTKDGINFKPMAVLMTTLSTEDDILPLTSLSGEADSGTGSCPIKKPGFFGPARKLLSAPPDFQKNHCPSILEGHFSTNLMLSAFHLQGPKSNIYVHFHWVNKQLTGISFLKWNRQSSV